MADQIDSRDGATTRGKGGPPDGGTPQPSADRVERSPVKGRPFDLEYAPAPEATDHVRIRERYGLLIGGKWVEPRSERTLKTINPASEEPLAEVAEAGEEDVDLAVRAARSAYTRTWSKLPGAERAKYLYRIARILQERAREFAVLETLDGGKPIKESRDVDLPLAAPPAPAPRRAAAR